MAGSFELQPLGARAAARDAPRFVAALDDEACSSYTACSYHSPSYY